MQILQCGQRRCGHKFQADQAPEVCPVCKCPMANGAASEHDWSEYSKADLLAAGDFHDIEIARSKNKAEVIAILEANSIEPLPTEE
ncbi:hypothetical protein LCGC14_0639960 [marine sediment metagenome]|uniref:Rubredoxin-like domain-containing protein n=1 Tax=marine sediment metagenome TaxID=412755 RepID=A0A0F9TKY7_9ZZZZ